MTDFDRNVRTLIVCFVVAVMFLIPMAMLEVNQSAVERIKVLGEVDGNIENEESVEEVNNLSSVREVDDIVLPNVDLN